MKYFKLIKKIAKLEYNLIFKALPKTQKDPVRDFFISTCTELSLIFPDHANTVQHYTLEQLQIYQRKRIIALLEKIQTDIFELPSTLRRACLGILRYYVNSRDFLGMARYQKKWIFWGISVVSPTAALTLFNQRLQELEKQVHHPGLSIEWQLPMMSTYKATLLLLSLHIRSAIPSPIGKPFLQKMENNPGEISLYMVNPEYGPTRWLYPCGGVRFWDEDPMDEDDTLKPAINREYAIQPLLLSAEELASHRQETLITKISNYYNGRLQSPGVTEIAGQYSIKFLSMVEKYFAFYVYAVMEENGWVNPWGIGNFTRYLQEVFNGCHDWWPDQSGAESDFKRFTESISYEEFLMLWENIVGKEEKMLKEAYQNRFGNSQKVQEHWKNVLFRQNNTIISISKSALTQICEFNIKNQLKSVPALVEKLQNDYRKNQLMYGQQIENTQRYAQKALQRVVKTALGKIAQDCFALMSGSIMFIPSETRNNQRRYDVEKHSITVLQDDEFSRSIWDTTPPWLLVFDGTLPGTPTDQMLLEGFIQSLCYFITAHLTPGQSSLPYWNQTQQQQWMAAQEQDTAHLLQIAHIVSAILQDKKLKKPQRKIWNQLTSQVDFLYHENNFQCLESPNKRHVRHLKSFGTYWEEIKNQPKGYYQYLYSPKKISIAGKAVELSEKYEKAYQLEWIKMHPTCENQSLVWSTLNPPRKFDASEMTISAFLWVYHRILKAESTSPLEFLGGYAQALMALGGQEELAALFVPHLHQYIQEVILPIGNQIYRDIHPDQSPAPLNSDHSKSEPGVILFLFSDSFKILLGSMAGLLIVFGLAWKLRNLFKISNRRKSVKPMVFLNGSKKIVKKSRKEFITPIDKNAEQEGSPSSTYHQPNQSTRYRHPIGSKEIKMTAVERRTAIVQLIESKYPDSIQNTNSIFIKTTAPLEELQTLLIALTGMTALKPSKNKENLHIEFADGTLISIGQCSPKTDKSTHRLMPITMDHIQKAQPKNRDYDIIPEKKSKKLEVVFPGDIGKLHLPATLVAKQLTVGAIEKIMRSIEHELTQATGQHYDFSNPQELEHIYLTKAIELSHIIRTTYRLIRTRVHGGLIRSVILGKKINDLDMKLIVPKDYGDVEALFKSMQQRKLIVGYQKSTKTAKIAQEMYIVEFRNSLVDMVVYHDTGEEEYYRGYNCDQFSLEICPDTLEARLGASEKSRRFLTAIKQRKTPVIEASVDPHDAWLLTDTMIQSSIIQMIQSVFPTYQRQEILENITALIQSPQSVSQKTSTQLSDFILTLAGHIQDPELTLHLLIRRRETGCHISPELYATANHLIPHIFHTAVAARQLQEEKSASLGRENLFFYFKKYVVKNYSRFGSLLPRDLAVFKAIMLAGLERNETKQEQIDRLFSETSVYFDTINDYLCEHFTLLQESKNACVIVDTWLTAMTSIHTSPMHPDFCKKLQENSALLGYILNMDHLYESQLIPPLPDLDEEHRNFRYHLLPPPIPSSTHQRKDALSSQTNSHFGK
jgi:hypothetical protein